MATAAGVFTNTVFGFIRASIMFAAIGTAGGELGGYTMLQAATYVWLGQALLAPIEAFGTREVSQRVHQGDIAVDLLRPTGFLGLHYAQKLGRSGFLMLGRGVPPLVVGALVTGLALPEDPLSYLLGALSLLLAIARATPFPSMIQTPIDTLSGRVPPEEAAGLLAVQAGWVALLGLAAWAMLRAGTRSLEVQGG